MAHPREPEHNPLRDGLVALVARNGRLVVAEPFFERGRRVVLEKAARVPVGKLVLVRMRRGGKARAQVERVIGSPDVARDVLEALMLDRGLKRRFPPGVERAAAEARDAWDGTLDDDRRDLRELPTFTIDPATAQDFDDAISAEALGGDRHRVWVHIADVSAYVRPGSAIDREAYRRATSVYVPGLVEPMLPEALSNDACSLRPGVDRRTVTVELHYEGATVVKAAFIRSLIRSDRRLTYDEVDELFARGAADEVPGLPAARAVARALGAVREARGAVAIDSSEPAFAFDRKGHVTASHPEEHTESHRLIEHLMIAANEAVAGLLEDRRVPALYRVHDDPSPPAVARLLEQLASLGVPTPPAPEADAITSGQAAELVGEASRLVEQWVAEHDGRGRRALGSLVLRSLKQARYQPQNVGHAGLASERYCHFTSPIRRYPDLVVHRALLSAVGADEVAPAAAALDEAGAWTSARERDAMDIERSADDVAAAFLLERLLFERYPNEAFEGEVVGLIRAGAFVAFDVEGMVFEGFVPVRRLRGDWWELNEPGTVLVGTESGRAIRLGDPIRVRVDRVEKARGRVDLVPADRP